ncbi:MAG: hypothetical protein QE487_15760 [Fluviicola sp.]|nr:hypothetical protein [Fluviicola sp.]
MKQLMILFFLVCSMIGRSQTIDDRWISNCNNAKEGYYVWYGIDRPEMGIPDSGKIEEGTYINDRKEGIWIKYHTDGFTPKLIGEYDNNRPNGKCWTFYPTGQLKQSLYLIKSHYRDSLMSYHENGVLEYEAFYNENGKEEGRVNYYFPNKLLKFTYISVNGVPTDTAYRYLESGILKESIIYDDKGTIKKTIVHNLDNTSSRIPERIPEGCGGGNGFRPNGYNKVYNEDNEVWQDGMFKEGKLWEGKVYIYDQEGILVKLKIYKNGVYHSERQL